MNASKGLFGILCGLVLPAAGCNMLALPAYMTAADQTEKVPAEFSKLDGRKVAVVVWAEPGTLYQFPHMRLELASQIAYQMNLHLKTTQIVPPETIADYQTRNPNWDATSPAEIGRQYGAQCVVFVELLEYSTREPKSPGLFHGRANASIVVYDVADPSARWTLTPAMAEFPSGRQSLMNSDDQTVHRQLLEILGHQVAVKFYDHEVPKDKRAAVQPASQRDKK